MILPSISGKIPRHLLAHPGDSGHLLADTFQDTQETVDTKTSGRSTIDSFVNNRGGFQQSQTHQPQHFHDPQFSAGVAGRVSGGDSGGFQDVDFSGPQQGAGGRQAAVSTRLGLGLGLGLANPNPTPYALHPNPHPNPNPNPSPNQRAVQGMRL